MFLRVFDADKVEKFININRIKEFIRISRNEGEIKKNVLEFHTTDLKIYYLSFDQDDLFIYNDLINNLCDLKRRKEYDDTI